MHFTVIDERGSLVASVVTAAPLDIGPDGSVVAHVVGHFEPGPGFAAVRTILDRFEAAYAQGDLARSLALHDDIDRLKLRATDSAGRTHAVSNVYFRQDALLFVVCSAQPSRQRESATMAITPQFQDFVEPCSHCGVPCLGTYVFSCADRGTSLSVEVDRPTLDAMLDTALAEACEHHDYSDLPGFVRSYNECVGPFDSPEPADVDIDDLVDVLELLDDAGEGRRQRLLSALRALVTQARASGAPIHLTLT